jgi:hypothetical protein
MNEDDIAVAVFSGSHADAAFLQSMLESEGITAQLDTRFMSVDLIGTQRLMVRRADAQHAATLVEGFRRSGPHR